MTSGAYQTGIVSYLTHRDLFPSLMKARLILANSNLLLTIDSTFTILIRMIEHLSHFSFSASLPITTNSNSKTHID